MLQAGTVKFVMLLLFIAFAGVSLCAGTFTFTGKIDKNPLTYLPGEKMVFTVQIFEDGKPVDGKN